MSRIRIVRTPIGEAPQDVREAWIGTTLPLVHPKEVHASGFGVVSSQRNPLIRFFYWSWPKVAHDRNSVRKLISLFVYRLIAGSAIHTIGYMVNSSTAIAILETKSPSAANWWKQNTPYASPGKTFLFDLDACELVE